MVRRGDFYEDDEPLDDLLEVFERGVKVETAAPDELCQGKTIYVTQESSGQPLELASVGNATVS